MKRAAKSAASTTQQTSNKSRPAAEARQRSTLGEGQSRETNRRAAAVLEVLAGVRTPSEAAAALGLSVNYYYLLERKALAGLLAACAPQPKGSPGPSCQQQLVRTQQELERCRQECLRQASLVRAAERAIGLTAVATGARSRRSSSPDENGPAKRRQRRPTVRALRAARALAENSSLDSPDAGVQPMPADEANTSHTDVATGKESDDGTRRSQAAGGGTR